MEGRVQAFAETQRVQWVSVGCRSGTGAAGWQRGRLQQQPGWPRPAAAARVLPRAASRRRGRGSCSHTTRQILRSTSITPKHGPSVSCDNDIPGSGLCVLVGGVVQVVVVVWRMVVRLHSFDSGERAGSWRTASHPFSGGGRL